MTLVGLVLVTSGAVQVLFTLEDNERALAQLQQEKAVNASLAIGKFVTDVEDQVAWASAGAGLVSTARTIENYERLLRQSSAVEVRYLDADHKEQIRVALRGITRVGSEEPYPGDLDFSQSVRRSSGASYSIYFSPIRFEEGSEPYMSVAVADPRAAGGITVAEVNLKLEWKYVRDMQEERGEAMVVDSDGYLIAHRDMNLVLKKTYVGDRPQVEAARTDNRGPVMSNAPVKVPRVPPEGWIGFRAMIAPSFSGQVLTAWEPIVPPGWYVFVEQPIHEVLRALVPPLVRGGVVLVAGLLIAIIASLLLARSMVHPIQALTVGAKAIGAGNLDAPIRVRTGDELEDLAEAFNGMAASVQPLTVANKDKDEILRYLSHQLRTPLNKVAPRARELLKGTAGPLNDKQADVVTDILKGANDIEGFIGDIEDYHSWSPKLSPFWLPDALARTLTMVREEAGRRSIELALAIDSDVGIIVADEHKVVQIVQNLVSNAVKFTQSGGSVTVTASMRAGKVWVAVQDTGPGVPPDETDRVFDLLYRGRAARGTPGTGFGLALVKKFVEGHGGNVWVESTLGEGSTFFFTLPSPDPLQTGSQLPAAEPSTPRHELPPEPPNDRGRQSLLAKTLRAKN
jgi:signal transduction histidine kinase